MNIQNISINRIKPYENNPRVISDDAVEKVMASIKEFGFQQPIVVDKDMVIIVGHTRLKASKKLGLKEVPVVIADNLTDEQARAYRLADNKTNEFSKWADDLLTFELQELECLNFDMEQFGFDAIFEEEPDIEEDDYESEPVEVNVKLGDIYQLGEHRLMCGDSTDKECVARLMDGNKADMVFTDPPYNVAFNGRSGKFDVILNDKLSDDSFSKFINGFLDVLKVLNPPTYYICCNWAFYGILQTQLKPKACIVWAKNVFGLGKGYRHQHEFILFDGFIDASITNESDLWNIKKDINYKHPTQKPVALSARAIKNSSKTSQTVLDLFGGSGSTLIACEQLNRKCFMMELDPYYCQVIIDRWEAFTGNKAVKVS